MHFHYFCSPGSPADLASVEAWFGNYQKHKRKTTTPHRLHADRQQVWQLYKFDLIDHERSHVYRQRGGGA